MQNIIYLVKPSSLKGWVISLATLSPYSHAVIEIDGIKYDASETRGDFNLSDIDLSKRDYDEFEVPGELGRWLSSNLGRTYDWKGVWGWLFDHPGDRNKFYCFEAIADALRYLGLGYKVRDKSSGVDILLDLASA